MGLVRIDHDPSWKQLGLFGVIWLVFFGALGGIVLKSGGSLSAARSVWGLAVVVPLVGWMIPSFMRIVYVAMAYAAFPIGFGVSHLILIIVYYLVLTPTGLLMRLFRYDPVARRFDVDAETYWCPREQDENPERYFRQF